ETTGNNRLPYAAMKKGHFNFGVRGLPDGVQFKDPSEIGEANLDAIISHAGSVEFVEKLNMGERRMDGVSRVENVSGARQTGDVNTDAGGSHEIDAGAGRGGEIDDAGRSGEAGGARRSREIDGAGQSGEIDGVGQSGEVDGAGRSREVDGAGRSREIDGVGRSREIDGVGRSGEIDGVGRSGEIDGSGQSGEIDGVGRSGQIDGGGQGGEIDGAGHSGEIDGAGQSGEIDGGGRSGEIDGVGRSGEIDGSGQSGEIDGVGRSGQIDGGGEIDGAGHSGEIDGAGQSGEIDGGGSDEINGRSGEHDAGAGGRRLKRKTREVNTKAAFKKKKGKEYKKCIAFCCQEPAVDANTGYVDWIQCDKCDHWFHWDCVGIMNEPKGNFFCGCDQILYSESTPTIFKVNCGDARLRSSLKNRLLRIGSSKLASKRADLLKGIYAGRRKFREQLTDLNCFSPFTALQQEKLLAEIQAICAELWPKFNIKDSHANFSYVTDILLPE
ncbi:Hypothetical predicted protein, partial [Paramuricea clavata]